jgi:2-oxoisovalerate dehydrogenase E2 component (dihydrolipoyl transacylase)
MSQTRATIRTFVLPDLGEGLTDAEIVRWLVGEGDEVRIDQPVVEVETAKSVVEVPTPYAGRVVVLHGRQGQAVGVGEPLLSIAADVGDEPPAPVGEPLPSTVERDGAAEAARSGNVLVGYGTSEAPPGRRRRPKGPPAAQPTAAPVAAPVAQPVRNGSAPRAVASPLVRRLAYEWGVELDHVRGTGPGGLITRADVERAVAGAEPAGAVADGVPPAVGDGERRIPLSASARAAAVHYGRSRAEIPEATIWVDVDATELVRLRESGRTPDEPGPGLLAYLARFVVAALRDYPVFNGRFDAQRQEIVASTTVNLGIAVQTDRGLVVPAVLGAQQCSIAELDERIASLTARARAGRLAAAELTAGTFTLNNYGGLGVDGSAAIINHPQVAMLGIGRVLERPWVVAGEVVPRRVAQLSFVFDHRVADGATAAGFVRAVADAVERPVRALAKL